MNPLDYYDVLGVEKDATARKIKEAYRANAFRYHPDRQADDAAAAEKMKQLNEAYAVLSNPDKRRDYDMLRRQYGSSAHRQFRQNYSEQDIFKDSDVWRVFEEMAKQSGFRGFEEVFRPFYGQGFQHFECRRPGFFAKGFFFSGHVGPMHGGGPRRGHRGLFGKGLMGLLANAMVRGATGNALPQKGADAMDTIHLTPNLSRTGGAYAYYHKSSNKKLIVKVPPGIRDGQRIRLAGLGKAGRSGAPPGDLYLRVRIHQSLPEKIKGLLQGVFNRKSP